MFEACTNGHADDDRKREATMNVIKPGIFFSVVSLYSYTLIAIKTLIVEISAGTLLLRF